MDEAVLFGGFELYSITVIDEVVIECSVSALPDKHSVEDVDDPA